MKLTISRGDYLTLRIMLALFVVAPLVSPFWHAWAWAKGDPLVWLNGGSPSQAGSGEAASPLETANGLIVRPSLETLSWEFTDPTWTQRLGAMLPGVLGTIAGDDTILIATSGDAAGLAVAQHIASLSNSAHEGPDGDPDR